MVVIYLFVQIFISIQPCNVFILLNVSFKLIKLSIFTNWTLAFWCGKYCCTAYEIPFTYSLVCWWRVGNFLRILQDRNASRDYHIVQLKYFKLNILVLSFKNNVILLLYDLSRLYGIRISIGSIFVRGYIVFTMNKLSIQLYLHQYLSVLFIVYKIKYRFSKYVRFDKSPW